MLIPGTNEIKEVPSVKPYNLNGLNQKSFKAWKERVEQNLVRCRVFVDFKKLRQSYKLIVEQKKNSIVFKNQVSPLVSIKRKDAYPFFKTFDNKFYIRLWEIGKGRFKTVSLGMDFESCLLVALSELPQVIFEADSFKNEVKALKKLQFVRVPGIIDTYGIYPAFNENRLIVSRYYCGGDLGTRIIKKDLIETDKHMIFLDILRGLSYLHENGIIHRDVKPENILLNRSSDGCCCSVVLSDYGSAGFFLEEKEEKRFMADFRHAPPEVSNLASWEDLLNPVYDIWCLGLTCIRMYGNINLRELPWEGAIIRKNYEEVSREKKYLKNHLGCLLKYPKIYLTVEKMIEISPRDRLSAQRCLQKMLKF